MYNNPVNSAIKIRCRQLFMTFDHTILLISFDQSHSKYNA